MYYDQFLRFLHNIGVKNAKLIMSLRFEGMVMIHDRCESETCRKERCKEGLVDALEYCIPFIRRFCPNLEKLSVHACQDHRYQEGMRLGVWGAKTEGPLTREEAFTPMFEKLKSIDSLKESDILGDSYMDEDMDFVKEAVNWVKERADNRKRSNRENYAKVEAKDEEMEMEALTIQVKEQNIHCGFCGEAHIWANC